MAIHEGAWRFRVLPGGGMVSKIRLPPLLVDKE
jgi:hypothetical protein